MPKRREHSPDWDRDVDQLDMEVELKEVITRWMHNHERSLQDAVGASEIGTPCDRRLAFKLAGVDAVPEQEDDDRWRAQVGTAVHADLARMLQAENERYNNESEDVPIGEQCHPWCAEDGAKDGHVDRWLVEYKTPVGTINGMEIPGNLDVFDRWTHTLVDWKIVGPTAIKNYRSKRDPGEAYKVQGQLYARGLTRVGGEDVRWVAIMFLPSNGELKMGYYWETEYDGEFGNAALRRARRIDNLVETEGLSVIATLDTVDDHCAHCPFFAPGTTDLEHECPGDPSLTENMEDYARDLLPNGSI